MKYYKLLIFLFLASYLGTLLNAQDITESILNSWNSEQDTTTEVKSTRTENIELIDKLTKQMQVIGKLNGNPIIKIENITLSYKEYKSMRDTMSILEKHKIKNVSVYSESCSKEVLRLLGESGESQVVEIKMNKNELSEDNSLVE